MTVKLNLSYNKSVNKKGIRYHHFSVSDCFRCNRLTTADKPNILFAIADDQSYPYASAYGIE